MEHIKEILKEQARNICSNLQEDLRNIHKYLCYKIIRNTTQTQWGGRFAAAPLDLWSVFLISYIMNIYIFYLYIPVYSCIFSLNIPYIFPLYFPYIFPWVFLNLFRQQYGSMLQETFVTVQYAEKQAGDFFRNLWIRFVSQSKFQNKICFR